MAINHDDDIWMNIYELNESTLNNLKDEFSNITSRINQCQNLLSKIDKETDSKDLNIKSNAENVLQLLGEIKNSNIENCKILQEQLCKQNLILKKVYDEMFNKDPSTALHLHTKFADMLDSLTQCQEAERSAPSRNNHSTGFMADSATVVLPSRYADGSYDEVDRCINRK